MGWGEIFYFKRKEEINLKKRLIVSLISIALLVVTVLPERSTSASVRNDSTTISMRGGDTVDLSCPLPAQVFVNNGSVSVFCPLGDSTLTPTPTSTLQPTSTATSLPPTLTPTPTIPATGTATATNTPNGISSMQLWHSPGSHDGLNAHEHGDKPPLWADQWSQQNFGHPVIFGGDEISSPMEQEHKHAAYKGFLTTMGGVELYIRYHAASNPADRSSAFHSYEIYAKDASGKVSFWQGLYWSGYPEFKSQRMTRRHEQPIDGFPGRDQFIIGSPDETDWKNFLRCEQWYTFGGTWAWDISITICGATTYFTYGEQLNDPMNVATWKRTGSLGLTRRIEASHFGVTNPRVTGVVVPLDKWYCVSKNPVEDRVEGATHRPNWLITGSVATPNSCPAGYLPQWLSSTFPSDGIYFESPGGNAREKTFPGAGIVTIPN